VVQVLFASNAVVGREALFYVSPSALVLFRILVAALFFFISSAIGRRERLATADLPLFAVCSLVGIAANQLLFMAGLSRTSATHAVVITTLTPVLTVGLSLFLGREDASTRKIIGLAVALFGALYLIAMREAGPRPARLSGDLLIVANSMCYAAYLVFSQPLFRRYSATTAMTYLFGFGLLFVLPFGAPQLITDLRHLDSAGASRIVYIALGPTVIAYALSGWALGRATSSLVAVYIYFQPPVGSLMAAVRLGERPTLRTAVSALFIAVGIWLVSRPSARPAFSDAIRPSV
jgi:drug/metabolite transporter (DMT)-like permease